MNDPRYTELYKQYYDFFNVNLDRLQRIDKYKANSFDVNKDQVRKLQNPKSFDYDQYFDGFTENQSLPGANLESLKIEEKPERRLSLKKSDYEVMLGKSKQRLNKEKIKALQNRVRKLELNLNVLNMSEQKG